MREQARESSALRGVGDSWGEDTFRYLLGATVPGDWDVTSIASLPGLSSAVTSVIEMPQHGWSRHECRPEGIADLYAELWSRGELQYEMEDFERDGTFVTEIIYRGR